MAGMAMASMSAADWSLAGLAAGTLQEPRDLPRRMRLQASSPRAETQHLRPHATGQIRCREAQYGGQSDSRKHARLMVDASLNFAPRKEISPIVVLSLTSHNSSSGPQRRVVCSYRTLTEATE